MSTDLQRDLARTLGSQYAIERELGGGGAWRAFLARDRTLYRDVVVKVLARERREGTSVERFIEEIRRTATLQEAHTVPLLLAGEMNTGVPYYVMPYVPGGSLGSRLAKGPLAMASAISIVRDVAAALANAHARGVVHLDLTLDNVLMSDGRALVKDFGVSTALGAARGGSQGGSRGEPLDPQIDVQAWGALAYELLSGTPPYSSRTYTPGGSAALADTPPQHQPPMPLHVRASSVPAPLAQLVMACLASDPAKRPKDARDIAAALTVANNAAPQPLSSPKRRAPVVIAGVLVVALLAAGYAFLRPRSSARGVRGAAAGLHTLALLPISDANNDSSRVYFTAGLTDDITTLLSRLPGISVSPRSSTAALRPGEEFDPIAVGQRLGIQSVLEARLRREGKRLEITVVLSRISDGSTLFREAFARDEAELYLLQDDVVQSVVRSFRLMPATSAKPQLARPKALEAYDLDLRARHKARVFSDSTLRQAITLYERAVAIDPNYLSAWNGLADCWRRLADDFMPARAALTSARTAIARAWALDSTSSQAIASRAIDDFTHRHNFVDAERGFLRALQLDSASASAPVYADLLLQMGKPDSARAVLERAARFEPMSQSGARNGPPLFAGVEQMEPLRATCSRAVVLDSARYTFSCLRMELRVSGQWRSYLATCDADDHSCKGAALFKLGRLDEARREAALLEAALRNPNNRRYVDPGLAATWFAQMGDVERTLAQLELALAVDSRYVAHVRDPYFFADVKGDPRFVGFVNRIALQ